MALAAQAGDLLEEFERRFLFLGMGGGDRLMTRFARLRRGVDMLCLEDIGMTLG
jgi:hypothetical protein